MLRLSLHLISISNYYGYHFYTKDESFTFLENNIFERKRMLLRTFIWSYEVEQWNLILNGPLETKNRHENMFLEK